MPTRAIKAIFFTRFHHEKGSRVLHQVPEGSITPSTSPSALNAPLFDLDSITTYLIPTQQFCDHLLTFCTNHYRVIGYPVCIRENKYYRNEFIFNFAVVIEENVVDWGCWGEVVRKLGRLLRALEEQGGFLSREEKGVWDDDDDKMVYKKGYKGFGDLADLDRKADSGVWDVGPVASGSKVYALCEMILEDLNNYCECMIPIDESNTINLKLFPTHAPPAPIHPHHVPILTISLASLTSPISSDLTITRILPFINGTHSVSHISQLADTDLSLTRKAIQHLVYYGCVVVLDVFSFGAIYAPTAEIGGFITDKVVGEECARYVKVPRISIGRGIKMGSESDRGRDDRSSISSDTHRSEHIASTVTATEFEGVAKQTEDDDFKISHETLITLYTSLRQGLTLKNWCLENLDLLHDIDVRRLITFGVIKGFLYRVHRYAIATSSSLPSAPPTKLQDDQATIRGKLNHKPSVASNFTGNTGTGVKQEDIARLDSLVSDPERDALPLIKFLGGMHSFDEICTELKMSEQVVENKIKGVGDVQFIYR
ncbi:nitrogen permease regulator 2 [Zopfia rhizophila CBS 207.26]|uniref:Nitrogen permease regulator 2 n=1 Tax=Zopfia rhizophila CBS 207.26 TaxID=1314779 RepID=A0A6A6DMK9_9PEZI|nr:nitrogen permease regulator 2 [Zopfia rhizophila CBS 207.26]